MSETEDVTAEADGNKVKIRLVQETAVSVTLSLEEARALYKKLLAAIDAAEYEETGHG